MNPSAFCDKCETVSKYVFTYVPTEEYRLLFALANKKHDVLMTDLFVIWNSLNSGHSVELVFCVMIRPGLSCVKDLAR